MEHSINDLCYRGNIFTLISLIQTFIFTHKDSDKFFTEVYRILKKMGYSFLQCLTKIRIKDYFINSLELLYLFNKMYIVFTLPYNQFVNNHVGSSWKISIIFRNTIP
ncbi:MAG: hypothetical protein ACFFDT_03115 [Candidatus Hodarchaeota archaeon]